MSDEGSDGAGPRGCSAMMKEVHQVPTRGPPDVQSRGSRVDAEAEPVPNTWGLHI